MTRDRPKAGNFLTVDTGGGEELGARQRSDGGHAGDHWRELVLAKSGLDEFVQLVDLLVESEQLQRQVADHAGDRGLAGKLSVLSFRGIDSGGSQVFRAAGPAVAQPRRQPPAAESP